MTVSSDTARDFARALDTVLGVLSGCEFIVTRRVEGGDSCVDVSLHTWRGPIRGKVTVTVTLPPDGDDKQVRRFFSAQGFA